MDSKRTSDALIEIYNAEKEPAIKKTVIQGLFQQSNATALVALARKEQDPALKQDIVQKLSVMEQPDRHRLHGGNPQPEVEDIMPTPIDRGPRRAFCRGVSRRSGS